MATIIHCTFTAPDATLLTAYPWTDPADINTVGAVWALLRPGVEQSMEIRSNVADPIGNSGDVLDCTLSDYVLTVSLPFMDTLQIAQIWCRYVNFDNSWVISLTSGNIYIAEQNLGVGTIRATTAGIVNGTYTLTLTLSGPSISVTVVGPVTKTVAYNSALFQTATKCGPRSLNYQKFDNFKIETASNVVPAIAYSYRRRRV